MELPLNLMYLFAMQIQLKHSVVGFNAGTGT
jgi:hypothetical protein